MTSVVSGPWSMVSLMTDDKPNERPSRVLLAPSLAVLLLAFGLLLVAVWWRGITGAVIYLLTAVTLAMLSVPALRRREAWMFYLVFVAVAVSILRMHH